MSSGLDECLARERRVSPAGPARWRDPIRS